MYQSNLTDAFNSVTDPGSVRARCNTGSASAYSYDYVTVEINDKFAMEVVDSYEALCWELVKNERAISLKTALTFKRDRKIKNKEQLNKIRIKLDEIFKSINGFEFNKTKTPFTVSMLVGVPGLLVFGGGMSLCLLSSAVGAIIGGVAIGVAGFGLCGLGYLVYRKMSGKKTAQMNGLIDSKREEISQLCEEAQRCLR